MKRIVFLIGVIICGCSGTPEKTYNENLSDPLDLFNKSHKLQGEVITLDKELVGMPAYRMTKLDSLLVIYDWQKANESFLFVVNIQKKKLIDKIIRLGWGPCEFSLLTSIKSDRKRRVINFMDPNKKQLYELKLNELDGGGHPCPEDVATFRDNYGETTNFIDVLKFDSNYLIGFGPASGDAMYSIMNASGNIIKNQHDFPKIQGVDNQFLSEIYFGDIIKNPAGNRIACVAQPGLLQIAEFKDEALKIIHSFESIKPIVSIVDNRAALSKNTKIGYVTSSATQKYIYVAYDDKTKQESLTSGVSCKYILVFDWDGNPHAVYELDYPIVAFTVDEEEKAIYAVANIPEPKIIRYDIGL